MPPEKSELQCPSVVWFHPLPVGSQAGGLPSLSRGVAERRGSALDPVGSRGQGGY